MDGPPALKPSLYQDFRIKMTSFANQRSNEGMQERERASSEVLPASANIPGLPSTLEDIKVGADGCWIRYDVLNTANGTLNACIIFSR